MGSRATPSEDDPDFSAGHGGDPFRRSEDSMEIEGVGGGEGNGSGGLPLPGGAEEFHGLGEGELLSGEAGDKTAAADLAAQLQVTTGTNNVAPWDGNLFAPQEAALEQAVAPQKLPGGEFGQGLGR